ncbi:MAG: VOC family protein [Actinomycetota bacterium]
MASPVKFAHIVLRTARYAEMVAWWTDFLEAEVRHGNDFISFLSYDDEHHRLAIANMPHLQPRDKKSAGVEHFAFTYATLDDLFAQYERMKAKGVSPYWTINHGMNFSAYYRDPDGNQVETQIDCMSVEDSISFMASEAFAANPIGIDVDFERLIARRRSGESVSTIIDYATAGS